jgi:hypothetical protein
MAFDMTEIGRYKYKTQSKAEAVARKLGIDGFHSHQESGTNNGKRYYMPGETHAELNQALKAMGKQPTGGTPSPSMSGGGMNMMSDMDMMGSEMGSMGDDMASSPMMESETSMSMDMGDPDELPDFSMIGDETDSVSGGLFDMDPDTDSAMDEFFTDRIDSDAEDPDKVGNFEQDSFIIGKGSPDDDDDENSSSGIYGT